ncbi:unnamed protein product, partial [Ilex paraguariensis]
MVKLLPRGIEMLRTSFHWHLGTLECINFMVCSVNNCLYEQHPGGMKPSFVVVVVVVEEEIKSDFLLPQMTHPGGMKPSFVVVVVVEEEEIKSDFLLPQMTFRADKEGIFTNGYIRCMVLNPR